VSRIFISYRREDTSASASRIYEWLAERYGDDQVFMDVDTIEPGLDWAQAIDRAVGSADLVLALIGSDWMAELNRRLERGGDDPMRHELETALARDMRVIPVLVGGAEMPRPEELPPELASLTRRHAFKILRPGDERFRIDKQDLLALVDRAIGADPIRTAPPPPPSVETEKPTPTSTPKPEADDTAVAAELQKWNWGAFLLTWIWGIGNGVFRSFLVFVPIYGFYEWFMLGKNGNRLAWQARPWDGIEAFHKTQRKWAMWGIIVDVILLIIIASSSGSSGSS
jgi:hypothetical protein